MEFEINLEVLHYANQAQINLVYYYLITILCDERQLSFGVNPISELRYLKSVGTKGLPLLTTAGTGAECRP